MNEVWRNRLLANNDRLASGGMRVLGLAFRQLNSVPGDEEANFWERALTFVGMIGILDPQDPGW